MFVAVETVRPAGGPGADKMNKIKHLFERLGGRPRAGRGMEAFGSGPLDEVVFQGKALLEEGRNLEALRMAQGAVDAGSHAPHLHYLLGLCLEQVGRHEEALRLIRANWNTSPSTRPRRPAPGAWAKRC